MGFVRSLAFLADLTSLLNVLNLKLQGQGQNISHLVIHIEGFRQKLSYLKTPCKK
jgi:hypothetical protein